MCGLPTSERTALLWGRRWWLAGRREPLEFENLTHAAEVLVTHLAGEPHPVRLRLIYQPATLKTVEVACPRGPRAALQKALAFEHSAIADPARAWSYEPILPLGDSHSTLLHYETEPGLFPLVARLAQSGVIVTAVWPLATLLQSLPKEVSETGTVLVLAWDEDLTHNCALAYYHPADGRRTVLEWWDEDGAADEAQAWIGKETARLKDDPVLLVCPMDAADPADPLSLPLHEALSSPLALPRSHPAQLLPDAPFVTAQRAAIAAGIVLLLAAGWSGAAYAREFIAWQDGQRAAAREKSTLRTEIEHYRINSAEIVALRTKLAGPGSSPPVGELLDVVCGALPPQLALDQIRVAQGRFTLSGHVAPGATAAWEQWRNRLGGRRWTMEPAAVPRDTGAFTIKGVFAP